MCDRLSEVFLYQPLIYLLTKLLFLNSAAYGTGHVGVSGTLADI